MFTKSWTVLCIYASQGILYYLTFFHLPVFFKATPHRLSNAFVIMFFFAVQLPYITKILFGFLEDRSIRRKKTADDIITADHINSIRRKYFLLGVFSFIPISVLTLVVWSISLVVFLIVYLISHVGLYLLDATIDGVITDENTVSRLRLVAVMQVGNTVGLQLLSMSFNNTVRASLENISAWGTHMSSSIVLAVLFVVLASVFLSNVPTKDQNSSLSAEIGLPPKKGFFAIEGHYVRKRLYLRRILPLMLLLAFLLDVDNIAEVTTEQSILARLGQEAFNSINFYLASTLIYIRYVSIAITLLIAHKFRKHEFKALFVSWFFILFYWSGFIYLNLEGLLVSYAIVMFVAPFFFMSFTYVFIKFSPFNYRTFGFQIFYFFYVLAEVVLPSTGLSLQPYIGYNGVFSIILISGSIVFVLIAILDRTNKKIKADEYAQLKY